MNTRRDILILQGSVALILVCTLFLAGCTTAIPGSPSASPSGTPASAGQAVSPAASPGTVPEVTATFGNTVTITYPGDWEKEEKTDTLLRDYGRVTTNIANLFSPTMPGGSYTTLSIDVDPDPVPDGDRYFNLATIALQKEYGTIEITHHTQSGQSQTSFYQDCPGCKPYNLEFRTKTLERWYHFVDDNGRFYIITVNNPGLNYNEVVDMIKSLKISVVPSVTKSR